MMRSMRQHESSLPYAYTPRRHGLRRARQQTLGAMLVMLSLPALIAYGALAGRAPLREDGCWSDGVPTAAKVVLLDFPKAVTEVEQNFVRDLVLREAARLVEGDRLTILVLDPERQQLVRTLFSGCRPRRGSDPGVNRLGENPDLLDRQYETRFRQPLEEVIGTLGTKIMPASTTPLLEVLHEIGTREDFFPPGTARRELHMVSDLRQHSTTVSHYGSDCVLADDLIYLEAGALRGATINVYRRPFGIPKGCSEKQVLRFWDVYFARVQAGERAVSRF